MNIRITPAKLSGSIAAIPSKSFAHRILVAAALADAPTVIRCPLLSKDIAATIGALGDLGAYVDIMRGNITIAADRAKTDPVIHCGESGTTARLLLPVAAALTEGGTLSGEGSLLSRPFDALCDAMAQNGCRLDARTLPISYRGRLQAGRYEIAGNISSQYISGLLFALPLVGLTGMTSRIVLTSPLESSGYVDMTLEVLRDFSITVRQRADGYEIPCGQRYRSPGKMTVEGDWSNAAFWLAAGISVTGLNERSLQKDRKFTTLSCESEIDAAEVPDLVPILAVHAAGYGGITKITNIRRLRLKESDRIDSITAMLRGLGADVTASDNELLIRGTGRLVGGRVDAQNDHRIVMAAAIASCLCEGAVTITGAEAVEKSYPQFFKDFNKLGGQADVI